MSSPLSELLQVTEQLKEVLNVPVTSANREEIIEQTNALIEKRETYIAKIETPFSVEEKQIGEQIIDLNIFIQKQMEQLFSDLKVEMKQVKQKKQSNRLYVNPYKSTQAIDGMYMDEKK